MDSLGSTGSRLKNKSIPLSELRLNKVGLIVTKKSRLDIYIVLIIFLIVGAYVTYWFYLYSGLDDAPLGVLGGTRSGTFGDAFGVINALFSALACSGVVATLLYQRRDLSAQKEKAEMQQFETQFYSRLTLQQNVVDRLDLVDAKTKVVVATGRDCLKSIFRHMKRIYAAAEKTRDHDAALLKSYTVIWGHFHSDLGVYMRSLYSLFKFLSESKYPDRRELGMVVRSLLSDFELALIFYNCLSEKGENFKRYAEEFQLFDNLDIDLLMFKEDVRRVPREAWGKNAAALAIYGMHES